MNNYNFHLHPDIVVSNYYSMTIKRSHADFLLIYRKTRCFSDSVKIIGKKKLVHKKLYLTKLITCHKQKKMVNDSENDLSSKQTDILSLYS